MHRIGWTETGPSISDQSLGSAFTVSQSGALYSITAAYGYVAGTNAGHLYLTDDVSKLGDTADAVESFTFTNLPAFTGSNFTPEVLTSSLNPILSTGTTYYLYGLERNDTWDAWNYNDQGYTGTNYVSTGGPIPISLALHCQHSVSRSPLR